MSESDLPAAESVALPMTLARRIQVLRENLDLTQRQLARKSQVGLVQIQDIESGVELFLSPSIRLKLARALRVKAAIIQDVEARNPMLDDDFGHLDAFGPEENDLLRRMIRFPEAAYACPHCQAAMIVRMFERRDLEENPIRVIKAHCSQCLFRLASE